MKFQTANNLIPGNESMTTSKHASSHNTKKVDLMGNQKLFSLNNNDVKLYINIPYNNIYAITVIILMKYKKAITGGILNMILNVWIGK